VNVWKRHDNLDAERLPHSAWENYNRSHLHMRFGM
jgi:hypothetical protein